MTAGALIYGAYYGDIASPSYAKFGGPEFDLPVVDLPVYRGILLDPARPEDLGRLRLDDTDLADLPQVHVRRRGWTRCWTIRCAWPPLSGRPATPAIWRSTRAWFMPLSITARWSIRSVA